MDRLAGGAEMPETVVTHSSALLGMCGRLAVVTGTLAVPADFSELYTRDQMASVVRYQNQELGKLRLELQELCRSLMMKGD